jgi:hypothetical protein
MPTLERGMIAVFKHRGQGGFTEDREETDLEWSRHGGRSPGHIEEPFLRVLRESSVSPVLKNSLSPSPT